MGDECSQLSMQNSEGLVAGRDVNSFSSECEDSCVCFYLVDLLAQF